MSAAWDTGLFDCFSDIKVLLVSWLCGVCQVSAQKAGVEGHECGLGDLIPVCLFPFCCQIITRGKIRDKFGIEGSLVSDFLTSWCCMLCAISQQTRQLNMKGVKPAGLFMDK